MVDAVDAEAETEPGAEVAGDQVRGRAQLTARFV
jgi:hypothetical protein